MIGKVFFLPWISTGGVTAWIVCSWMRSLTGMPPACCWPWT